MVDQVKRLKYCDGDYSKLSECEYCSGTVCLCEDLIPPCKDGVTIFEGVDKESYQKLEAELTALRPLIRALAGYSGDYDAITDTTGCHFCFMAITGRQQKIPHQSSDPVCPVLLAQGWVKKWEKKP